MKKLMNKASMLLMVLGLLSVTALADVCVWDGTSFPGSYGCSNENCGYGCGTAYNYTAHWNCKPSLGTSMCCICSWDTFDCNCTGGLGHGSVSVRSTGFGLCPTYGGSGSQPSSCVMV